MAKGDKKYVDEHLKLQQEFLDYIEKNGFDYTEYCSPTPGGFYDKYKQRWEKISAHIAPELHYHGKE
jgi:hypothetical protein